MALIISDDVQDELRGFGVELESSCDPTLPLPFHCPFHCPSTAFSLPFLGPSLRFHYLYTGFRYLARYSGRTIVVDDSVRT